MSQQEVEGRPRVVVSSTASLDGRITFSRRERLLTPDVGQRWQSHWPPDVADLESQRTAYIEEHHHPTVVLEGSGTFVPDTAGSVTGIPGQHDASDLRRDWLPRPSPKWFAVVDGRGRVPWSYTGAGDVSLLVLACDRTPLAYLGWLRELEVPYLIAGDDRVNLPRALEKMPSLLSATCVVSEGGGGINGALLRSGVVDELHMIWFPAVIGGADTPSSFDGKPLAQGEAPNTMIHRGTVVGGHGSIWSWYESSESAS
ncbi:MAG TPA: dihydrofolate reductase family protein [Streptosporangiaceae bacterium]|nr:dihydrofolate reductase family protein [Streptosporangiaceae bacterium]